MVELFKSLSSNLHFGYLLHEPEIDYKNNKIYTLKDKLTFKNCNQKYMYLCLVEMERSRKGEHKFIHCYKNCRIHQNPDRK